MSNYFKYLKKINDEILNEEINLNISKNLESIFTDLILATHENSESIVKHIGLALKNTVKEVFKNNDELKKGLQHHFKNFTKLFN